MNFEGSFFALLGFTLIREVFFMRTIQQLIDKLMCRSLHEYKLAQGIGKTKVDTEKQIGDEFAEDLGALQGIM